MFPGQKLDIPSRKIAFQASSLFSPELQYLATDTGGEAQQKSILCIELSLRAEVLSSVPDVKNIFLCETIP